MCGFSGSKVCGKCKQARYCSREHQAAHWKLGHSSECSKGIVGKDGLLAAMRGELFPESEIVVEKEKLTRIRDDFAKEKGLEPR